MTICLSHSGKTMYAARESAREMLVATVDGVTVTG